jgi:uncharacterized protein (DUF433 family)
MGAREDIERLLGTMTRADKARRLQAVVRGLGDAYPGIEATRTRIPVWVLEQARRLGTSEADLLRCYPTLRAEDLVNAWGYARAYRDEINRHIEENEAA